MTMMKLRSNSITSAEVQLARRHVQFDAYDIVACVLPDTRLIQYGPEDAWYLDYARLWKYRDLRRDDRLSIELEFPGFVATIMRCTMVVEDISLHMGVGQLVKYRVAGRILEIQRKIDGQ